MKINNLLKKLILFSLIAIVVILLLNSLYVHTILSKKTFYRKEAIYRDYLSSLDEKKFDFVFFGDSHTFHDIDPAYIENSYNYGTGAENYIKTYYKLRKMLEKEDVKIEAVVLEIDPHTFSTRLTDQTHLFNELEVYSDFVDFDEVKKVRNDSIINLFIEAKIPVIGKGKEFGILFTGELNELSGTGLLKNKANFSLMNKSQVALESYQDAFVNQSRISGVSLEYFVKTLELAEQNNVKIFFIIYPHTKEFNDLISTHEMSNEEYYTLIFNVINSTLNDNYVVLNYYDDFADEDYLFGDPAHLNYVGSEILSKQVNEDLSRYRK